MLNQTRTTETLRLIRCDIADETYGLDMSWVRSVQRTDRLHRNPIHANLHRPVGWMPGNEGDIPVFSLASRLGRSPLPSLSKEGRSSALQRIIVLNPPPSPPQAEGSEKKPRAKGGEEGLPWGLLVDRVPQVIQIPADRVVPLPPIVGNSHNYFKGVIKLDEELILYLSLERLYPDASLSAGGPVKAEAGLAPAPGPAPAPTPPKASAGGHRRSHGQIVVFFITEPYPVERALSFGLSISQVLEVLEPLPMIPVPAAPAFVLGLANWRDQPVPVIDLASRLGLAELALATTHGRTRLMIARDKGHVLSARSSIERNSLKGGLGRGALVGFLVRPTIRMLRLPIAHQLSRRPLTLDQTLTKGIFELEKETLVIPDIQSIL
jgi:chemotaxis signal transduction protein